MAESAPPLEGGELLRFVYTCPLALLLTDSDGGVQLLNGAATSLLMPFASGGEFANLFTLIDTHDSEFREFLLQNQSRLKSGQLVRRVAMKPESLDRFFHLAFTFGPFDNGYSVTAQDVTGTVLKEEENKELLAREAHERGRVEVASGILHDLGNALTGIATRAVDIRGRLGQDSSIRNLDRLGTFLRARTTELDTVLGAGKGQALLTMLDAMLEDARQQRQASEDGMEKMLTFLAHAQELITINRAFAGSGSNPARSNSTLCKVVDDLLVMIAESVSKRGGRVETDLEESLPAVGIDRSRLMQVLLNLAKNATEAYDTLDNGDGLRIRLSVRRDEAGRLVILFADNGPGFAGDIEEKLFDHGYSTKDRGSGEGLSGSRRIVAGYNGELVLESEGPGRGATAKIVFPKEVFADDNRK